MFLVVIGPSPHNRMFSPSIPFNSPVSHESVTQALSPRRIRLSLRSAGYHLSRCSGDTCAMRTTEEKEVEGQIEGEEGWLYAHVLQQQKAQAVVALEQQLSLWVFMCSRVRLCVKSIRHEEPPGSV